MKNFILGVAAALVLIGVVFAAHKFFPGLSGGGGGPVSPEMLRPGVSDYGTLQVVIKGNGQPLQDVEVDLGTIGGNGPEGPMSFTKTGADGMALFEKVPVGTYNIFFNNYSFPQRYEVPSGRNIEIVIAKGQTTEKTIELTPKQ